MAQSSAGWAVLIANPLFRLERPQRPISFAARTKPSIGRRRLILRIRHGHDGLELQACLRHAHMLSLLHDLASGPHLDRPERLLRQTVYQGHPHLGFADPRFLASGQTTEQLLEAYPQLTAEDILAAIAYGAEVARERVIPVPNAAAE